MRSIFLIEPVFYACQNGFLEGKARPGEREGSGEATRSEEKERKSHTRWMKRREEKGSKYFLWTKRRSCKTSRWPCERPDSIRVLNGQRRNSKHLFRLGSIEFAPSRLVHNQIQFSAVLCALTTHIFIDWSSSIALLDSCRRYKREGKNETQRSRQTPRHTGNQ